MRRVSTTLGCGSVGEATARGAAAARSANPAPRIAARRAADDQHWSQLMAAAQAGDRRAYDHLLREIVPYVRAIAWRAHRSPEAIEEVVQEVLLSVHRVRQTYDPARPFRHWLRAIAHRRSIDALRQRCRHAAYEVAASPHLADDRPAETSSDGFDDGPLQTGRLHQAIAALPARQRQAIELLKLREMSLNEASRLTNCSVAALKVNAHRALKSLRKQLLPS